MKAYEVTEKVAHDPPTTRVVEADSAIQALIKLGAEDTWGTDEVCNGIANRTTSRYRWMRARLACQTCRGLGRFDDIPCGDCNGEGVPPRATGGQHGQR